MGRNGKFSAKSNAWEDNKVILEGEELVIPVKRGPLVHREAAGCRLAGRAGATAGEVGAPIDRDPDRSVTSLQGALRRNRCAATGPLRRNRPTF